jgi:hypothetical protein
MELNLKCGEILVQKIKGKIEKEVKAPPKLDIVQQKQFMCDAQRDLEEDRSQKELQHIMQISLEEDRVHEELQCTTKISLEESHILLSGKIPYISGLYCRVPMTIYKLIFR